MNSATEFSLRRLYAALDNLFLGVRYPSLGLSLKIPSHLTYHERLALMTLAGQEGIETIVEIGSYLGASATALAAGAKAGGIIYCIDTWNNDAMTEGQQDTFSNFLANTRRYSNRIMPVRGWSTARSTIMRVFEHRKTIDLLLIDGDHSYEGVLADWEAYRPMLSKRAIVAMHDIGWAEGVQRVVEEDIRPLVGEEAQLPNLWWGRLA
jgi:predicted O-methyltransferase YrrM